MVFIYFHDKMWFDLLEIELRIDLGTEFGMQWIFEYKYIQGTPLSENNVCTSQVLNQV